MVGLELLESQRAMVRDCSEVRRCHFKRFNAPLKPVYPLLERCRRVSEERLD